MRFAICLLSVTIHAVVVNEHKGEDSSPTHLQRQRVQARHLLYLKEQEEARQQSRQFDNQAKQDIRTAMVKLYTADFTSAFQGYTALAAVLEKHPKAVEAFNVAGTEMLWPTLIGQLAEAGGSPAHVRECIAHVEAHYVYGGTWGG